MAKKKTVTTKKKSPIQRVAKAPERKVYTYRVIAPGCNPELVQCHSVNVYNGSVEFVRRVPTPYDPFEEVTILMIPAHTFSRVELVEELEMTAVVVSPPFGAEGGIVEVDPAVP